MNYFLEKQLLNRFPQASAGG